MIDPEDLGAAVAAVLARAPLLRQDLATSDPASRARAEETLADMIEAAIKSDKLAE